MNTLQLLVVYTQTWRRSACEEGQGFEDSLERLSTRGLQILRVFCSTETPLYKGAADSPSFLFNRDAFLQGTADRLVFYLQIRLAWKLR